MISGPSLFAGKLEAEDRVVWIKSSRLAFVFSGSSTKAIVELLMKFDVMCYAAISSR
jgi:hypothetical protein